MKTLNFNFEITDMSDKPISEYIVKEAVGNLLASQATAKPIRAMEIAKKIYKEGIIELTTEDILLVQTAIEQSKTITDLVKAQLLKALE